MTTEKKKPSDYNCWYRAPDCEVCDARHFCKEHSVGGVCEDTRLGFLIVEGCFGRVDYAPIANVKKRGDVEIGNDNG